MIDYKERYEGALGWMRDVYPTLTGAAKEDAEHFFPELKDSEDERLKSLQRPKCGSIGWEDCREEELQTRFAFYTYKDEPGVLYLSNLFVEEASRNAGFGTRILHAAEKVAETIGASSIRLKVKQDSPANAWYRKHGYGYMTFEDGYDWLEKR